MTRTLDRHHTDAPVSLSGDTTHLSGEIVRMNLSVYADRDTVNTYVHSRYHATRRMVARTLLEAHLTACPEGPVLEVGGGGHSLIDGLPAGRTGIVTDANPALVPPGGECVDVTQPLPFADGSVSAIVMCELIEHLFLPPAVLREFQRVLKPDGVLILTTPNLATLQDRLRFLIGRSPRQVDTLHPYLYLHIRPFTASSLRRLLEWAGFSITSLRSNYVGWQLSTGRWVHSRLLARLMPSLGGSLVVSARRR